VKPFKTALAILSVGTLVGCITGSISPSLEGVIYSSSKLQQWTEEYVEKANNAGIPVFYDELVLVAVGKIPKYAPLGASGVCLFYTKKDGSVQKGRSVIVLKEETWGTYDRCTQKHLLFHELGHCLSHLDDLKENGKLMSSFFRRGAHNCTEMDDFFKGKK
jgi:hypothetical protein